MAPKKAKTPKVQEASASGKASRHTTPGPPPPAVVENKPDWLADERPGDQQEVWLVTFAKILSETALQAAVPLKTLDEVSRETIRDSLLDAFANPMCASGGRPRKNPLRILRMGVFLEMPKHFHAVIKVSSKIKFMPYKQALRERAGLASHWSPNHTTWDSALRYCALATERKPLVDATPLPYTVDGNAINFYEESQEPWNANVQKRRREEACARREIDPKTKKPKATRFGAPELKDLILAESLFTPAAVITYCQQKGDAQCRAFVSKQQRKLKELIGEAREWRDAPKQAAQDSLTGWDVVHAAAAKQCSFGCTECKWRFAHHDFFRRNKGISKIHMAQATAKVLAKGPSKTAPVPCLVGPSNSGKSTIYDPVDKLFGEDYVFHTPALGSMALANLATKVVFPFEVSINNPRPHPTPQASLAFWAWHHMQSSLVGLGTCPLRLTQSPAISGGSEAISGGSVAISPRLTPSPTKSGGSNHLGFV